MGEKMKKIIALSLLCTSMLLAEDTAFVTHTELGYVETSGNTETTAATVDFMGKKSWGDHSVQLDFDYLYGEQNSIENNNKLETVLNYDYKFSKNFGLNYLIGYKDDKFSGFDYQFYTGPGVKWHAHENDAHVLDFQSNVLYSKDSGSDKFYNDAAFTDETKYPFVPVKGIFKKDGQTNEYGAFFIQGDYEWKITESFKFLQMLNYRVDMKDSDIYFINSKSAVESKISDTFSMGINYKVSYVNTPPVGNERTDKTFTVSLIIDY